MQRIGWQVNHQAAERLRNPHSSPTASYQSPLQLNRLVGGSGERRRDTKVAAAEQVEGIRAEGDTLGMWGNTLEGGCPPDDQGEACDFPLHSVGDTPLTHSWPGHPPSFP